MVELLAPAGDMACFEAAVSAGADAVYVGGERFGARAYAKNFSEEELLQVLKTAHLLGKKVYLTINTLMKEKELSELVPYLMPYYEEGLDGVIVQDFGALSLIREAFPFLPLHASTQMTVTGEKGAGLLKEFGVSRVVPARELSLEEIVQIKENTGLEMETFIHGAMCYSYSGQCLFSSMLGPRSGNRGRCAGPCRLPYQTCLDGKILNAKNEMYQLSLKDLCVLEILPRLIDAKIDSFKIEGRMKTPQYVSFVTSMYRKYIDFYMEHPDDYRVSKEDMMQLRNNFSRGSIQSGYYFMHNGRDLVTLHKPGYQSFDVSDRETKKNTEDGVKQSGNNDRNYKENLPKIGLVGHFVAHGEKPLEFTVVTRDSKPAFTTTGPEVAPAIRNITLTVTGNLPQKAQSRAATEADVEKQLMKTGNTPFVFSCITYDMANDLFLPNKELNELRREALEKVEEALLQPFKRTAGASVNCRFTADERKLSRSVSGNISGNERFRERFFYVGVSTVPQLLAVPEDSILKRIFLSFDALEELQELPAGQARPAFDKIQALRASGIEIYLRLPAVVRLKAVKLLEKYRNTIVDMDFDGFCVNNLESLAYIRANYEEKTCITDSGFYLFNSRSCDFCQELDTYEHILSYELHKKEIESILEDNRSGKHSFILPVYGYIPLMESAGCVLKTNGQCRKEKGISPGSDVFLIDRQSKKLRVLTHCSRCENTIYNSVPLSLYKETAEIKKMPLKGVALNFTTEDSGEMTTVLESFMDVYRKERTDGLKASPLPEFTKGHFLKGVE